MLEKAGDVVLDFFRISRTELLLKRTDNLFKSVLAVATSHDLKPRPFQFERSFGHEQRRFLIRRVAQAATGSETRLRIWGGPRHHTSFGRNAPGGGPPGSTYAKYSASNCAQRSGE